MRLSSSFLMTMGPRAPRTMLTSHSYLGVQTLYRPGYVIEARLMHDDYGHTKIYRILASMNTRIGSRIEKCIHLILWFHEMLTFPFSNADYSVQKP